MKRLFCLLMMALIGVSQLFAQDTKIQERRFTDTLTHKDIERDEWVEKYFAYELTDYFIEVVTTKKKDDDPNYICLQIIDKKNGRFVQELDIADCCMWRGFSDISGGDFNFDGYEDFSLFEANYSGPNTSEIYFLYDPEKHIFFQSDFSGTSLEFNSASKTIYMRNQCCAGSSIMEATYKVVNNRMVLIEQHCNEAIRDEDGIPIFDDNGDIDFFETDCGEPYLSLLLKSKGLKQNFSLTMAFYDEDMAGGYVLYNGQTERIPIHHSHSEILENNEDEGRPNLIEHSYNEVYNDEVTGTYTLTIQGAVVYGASYTRNKDNKKFVLEKTGK